MAKRPSFQFYPMDWLSDPNVIAMSATERGAYIQLLATLWTTDDCAMKADQDYLAKICQVDKSVITEIYHCFKVKRGMLRHGRLDKERMKQDEYKKKKSEAGKKGMSKRWNNSVITKDNSSSSSSIIKKEKYKKKKESLDIMSRRIYEDFETLCSNLGLENEVDPVLYLTTHDEYSRKFPIIPALRECLYWCKDHDKKKITIMRIRNWLANKKKWDKETELKKQTERQDKIGKDSYLKPNYKPPVDISVNVPEIIKT